MMVRNLLVDWYKQTKLVSKLHHKVILGPETRKDLLWWYWSISSHNGVCMFPKEWDTSTAQIVYTDASNTALGVAYGHSWTWLDFTGEYKFMMNYSIAWREMAAMVLCLATFGDKLHGQQVFMNVDNEVVRLSLNKGYSRDPFLMALVRSIYYYTTIHKIDYRAIRVATYDNGIADAISRKDWVRLFALDPYMSPIHTNHPNLILDF